MTADDGQALSFGSDAAGYDAGRLPYPAALWQRLAARDLREGAAIFEIGAGTGLATRRLIAARPTRLTAIEPDARMAERLSQLDPGASALEVRVGRFEEAVLAPEAYDLGVAATSFHWCDTAVASRLAFDALRPGGVLALFWNRYQTVEGADAFSRAIAPHFAAAGDLAGAITASLPDTPRYRASLAAAGFGGIEEEMITWHATQSTEEMLALYATFSVVRGLAPPARATLLTAIRRTAEDAFGGQIEREYHTQLLIAEKPAIGG
ncbi:MAG: class I SAM-dependent methyltransferase [Pseudomonadota bacterium]